MSKHLRSFLIRGLKFFVSQRGGLLVESVVSLSLLTIAGFAVFRGVQTSYIGRRVFDSQSTAENLIRNQLEYVFNQAYLVPGNSYLTVAAPTGYSVTAQAVVYDISSADVETISVTVYQGGQPIKTLETLRSNR
jgi:hypothetical protein